MNLLDKHIVLEANSVTADDYKKMTGSSIEELRARIKKHVEEVKSKMEEVSDAYGLLLRYFVA